MPAPTNPDATTVRAGGVLLFVSQPKLEFLLLRHPKRWDLPKGHCDEGESFLDAAIRETEEETGIPRVNIRVDPQFCFEVTYPVTYKRTGDRVFQKTVQYFLGFLNEKPELVLTEHTGFAWFEWSPPHAIQTETIDPLLNAVQTHLSQSSK